MAFIRTQEQTSPFSTTQTVAQVATAITNYLGRPVTADEVLVEMKRRSIPGATTSTQVNFSRAEILLRVFQDN